ncbi:type II secretion system protein GspD [Campylobacter hominis]
MKKLILLVLICLHLSAAETKINLLDFANLASENSKVDILLSDKINPNDFYFYTPKATNISIEHFRKALNSKNLRLVYTDKNFYYVDFAFDDNSTKKLRSIDLKNNSFDDIKKIVDVKTESGINDNGNVAYLKGNNSIVFNATDSEYEDIYEIAKKSDKRLDQVNFKLLITETNVNKVRDLGTDLNGFQNIITRQDFNYFVNLITMPFTAETNIITSKKSGFFGVLNMLEQNGITKISQSPFLVAKNGSEVYFSSVKNIPYLVQNDKYQYNGTSTSNSYQYKDIGLKIKIKPTILNDYVDFDLDLTVEDLIDDNSLTPRTSKKELKSSYTLNRGEILVLSGINKENAYTKRNGIPLLKDIPLIKYLFSIEQDYKESSVITLSIQVN